MTPGRISLGVAWVSGVCAAHLLPRLPETHWLIVWAAIAALGFWVRSTRLPAALLLGACWAWAGAQSRLDDRLPLAAQGSDIEVTAQVVDLPQQQPEAWRFDVAVTHWRSTGEPVEWSNAQPMLRVSWYGHREPILPGSTFRGVVRLRVPYALVNPGGFDFERHALVQGIDANAYVREGVFEPPSDHHGQIDRTRQRLAHWIRAESPNAELGSLLAALAVGDQQAIDDPTWARLRNTGTTHLMAISGMHVGLAAAGLAWLAGLVYRIWPALALRVIRPDLMAIAGLLGAISYGCLASFSLPVLRTVMMIAIVVLATLLRIHLRTLHLLLVAAVLALLMDPLAPLAAGFWLSFLGVLCLILVLYRQSTRSVWSELLRAQWAASLFLLPIGIAWFDQASLVGPLANLLAIPVVTFVIVPLLLLALLLSATPAGAPVVALAGWILSWLWQVLGWCERLPMASIELPEPGPLHIGIAMIGAFLWLLPKPLPGKTMGLACLLPLFWPARADLPQGQAEVSVLDVGQGLSVLVQTRDHALLYDTGAKTRGGFDLGEAAVAPALRSLGVRSLDVLMLSHLDNDHAGGREAVLRAFPGTRQRVGIDADPAPRCVAGQHWLWNEVSFRFLHPPEGFPDLGNESSCLLLVEAGGERVLIPGDIGLDIESRLLADPQVTNLAALIVPHHGSRHASGAPFLAWTAPRLAVVSAGFGNRFDHPTAETRQRYLDAGIPLLNTAHAGLIALRVGNGDLDPRLWRREYPRYWRHTPETDKLSR
ncbi:MAG: DNA internalization-related competence protein ComEC/Rec2 [Ahniella sp.]|nr:DNA internalization-related competence protein ComEC/Rec2 [Ahniella sp.]